MLFGQSSKEKPDPSTCNEDYKPVTRPLLISRIAVWLFYATHTAERGHLMQLLLFILGILGICWLVYMSLWLCSWLYLHCLHKHRSNSARL